jgi:ATP-binding cassette subfamily B protein
MNYVTVMNWRVLCALPLLLSCVDCKTPLRGHPIPLILSARQEDDGAASLAMALAYLGKPVSLEQIRPNVLNVDGKPTGLTIVRTAQQHGVEARGVRVDLAQLDLLPKGSILHWDGNHFVVLERITQQRVEIIDPALGRQSYSRSDFEGHFLKTGVALLFGPAAR